MSNNPRTVIDGRSCGGCTLCCKVMSITELGKPQGKWCEHAQVGHGCKVYDGRPNECANFYCGYLLWPAAGAHWFPAKSKMVLTSELEGKRIVVRVDPGKPTVWRDRPFYDDIKRWAALGVRDNIQVLVCVGIRVTVILPDREVDLGPVTPDDRIISGETVDEAGRRQHKVFKLRADDPRIAGRASGAFDTLV